MNWDGKGETRQSKRMTWWEGSDTRKHPPVCEEAMSDGTHHNVIILRDQSVLVPAGGKGRGRLVCLQILNGIAIVLR